MLNYRSVGCPIMTPKGPYVDLPTPAVIGRRIRTPKPCSCFMCGNQRQQGILPIQELKANITAKEWEAVAIGNLGLRIKLS